MRSLNEYIEIIKKCSDVLRSYFGVTSLRIFGSVARNEQNEDSDVDVCVDMKPNLFLHVELKKYLEEKFGCPVDVIRLHKNMNEFLKRQIEKDGILVSL
ncbi:nucleotidyltransferase family protein [Bacteroides sp. GD17]|jgi:predicted nucleotidyltransferase|uniref:nucleotidyltransferase family protein n=1 Tax=Bacteroides sp. GD17 TaxID=3139826 RepID=UPI0025E1BEE5|nr:nucleotidyltransferase family protein [uncultured Bacteroides sp.]